MFECTSRPACGPCGETRGTDPSQPSAPRVPWEAHVTLLKRDLQTLSENLEAVQGNLQRLEKDGDVKKDIQTLSQNLEVVRGGLQKLEKDIDAKGIEELKLDTMQRLRQLEAASARTAEQLPLFATHEQLAKLSLGSRTVTKARMVEVVQEEIPLTEGDLTGGSKEMQEKIDLRLSEFEQRLSKVEEQTLQNNLRAETEGLAELEDLAVQDSLVERGQEPDNSLREPASEGDGDIHPAMGGDKTQTKTTEFELENIAKHIEHEFQSTIWDTAFFAGTSQMSIGASVVIIICLVLTILLLLAFGFQVNRLVLDKYANFDEESQKDFQFWRSTAAHAVKFQNPISGASMVSSVCNGHRHVPESNLQLELADQLKTYTSDTPIVNMYKGVWMCVLAVFVWYLVLVVELRSVIEALRACMNIPIGMKTTFKQDLADASKVIFVSISPFKRVFVVTILALRVAVVAFLGVEGTLFLMYEVDLENMILNSVGLQMILSFDELIFCLLPIIPQATTKHVAALPIRVRSMWWDTWGLFVALACLLAAASSFFQVIYMSPWVEQLENSYDALCGGGEDSYNFVVAVDEIGIPWAAPTPPTSDDMPEGYAERAIIAVKKTGFHRLRLDSDQRGNVGKFMQVASGDRLRQLMVQLPEFTYPTDWKVVSPFENSAAVGWDREAVDVLGGKDFADEPGTVYNNFLKDLLQVQGNVTCAQVPFSACARVGRSADHVVMRQLCPGRCGCDSPSSGTVANTYGSAARYGFTGCADWNERRKKFVDELQALPCTDTKSRIDMVSWSDGMGAAVFRYSGNEMADDVLSAFDSGGCPDVAKIRLGSSRICQETSLPAICPESCGCNESQTWTSAHASKMDYCPYRCQRTVPPCMTIAVNHTQDPGTRGPHVGVACAFPYKYKEKIYNSCTEDDWPNPWCPVTLLDGVSDQWGDCPNSSTCMGRSKEQ